MEELHRQFVYSAVRCLPLPRTGEFVNVGVVVEDLQTGRLYARSVSSYERARRLGAGDRHVQAAKRFFRSVENRQLEFAVKERIGLTHRWSGVLDRLQVSYRNIIQVSPPLAVVGPDAQWALDHIFDLLVFEPTARRRPSFTRLAIVRSIERAYLDAEIHAELVRSDMELYVGSTVHQPIDLAVANGRAFQLTQVWSFDVAGVRQVATEVKAWAYAIERLRHGESASLIGPSTHSSQITADVDVEVVVAPPTEDAPAASFDFFEESAEVLRDLQLRVSNPRDVDAIASRAAQLLPSRSNFPDLGTGVAMPLGTDRRPGPRLALPPGRAD